MEGKEQKYRSIFSRFYSEVVVALGKGFDAISGAIGFIALFLMGMGVLLICGVIEWQWAGVERDAANKVNWGLMYLGWILLVLATVNPIFVLADRDGEAPLGVVVSVSIVHLLIFVLISIFALSYPTGDPTAITALLAALLTVAMLAVGWMVHHQSTARAARRAHTLNVVLQSRLSEKYQEMVVARRMCYPVGVSVTKEDGEICNGKERNGRRDELITALEGKQGCELKLAKRKLQEFDDKVASLSAIEYLLNYFEFICAGVRSRDLDDGLLWLTVSGIIKRLFIDAQVLIDVRRKEEPTAFCEIEEVLLDRWWNRWSEDERDEMRELKAKFIGSKQ